MKYYINVYDLQPPYDHGFYWSSKKEAEEAARQMREKPIYRIHVRLK